MTEDAHIITPAGWMLILIMFGTAIAFATLTYNVIAPVGRQEYTETTKRLDQRLDDISTQIKHLNDMSSQITDLWRMYYYDVERRKNHLQHQDGQP
jgi:hypothetical protein